ncbi:glycosyltransferase family 2 protein [Candidatus Chloroploca sp. Khr17]|uniref:glycosyltransferase n=1 Tax=Candidatus Chloroploca sp. Khr17 TaxID=2496869 RepID=UPI00101C7766|nr:glycosyltransferase family 2 protein [Candidatus Chloroploca sp. Khr17]
MTIGLARVIANRNRWQLAGVLLAGVHILATWLAAVGRGRIARWNAGAVLPAPAHECWPSVSVLVPAWRERGILDRCVHSLRAVDYPDWEVIIVAGGPDGTYAEALALGGSLKQCRVLEQQPRGKNAALNQGLALACGEVIVVLDADSQVAPGWLHALVAPIGHKVMASTGHPVPLRSTAVSQTEQLDLLVARGIHGAVTLQGSGSIAVARSVIDELGGFPEEVLVGVDWDLDARLAARGVTRAVCPEAIVYTERPATLAEYWRNEVRWRRAHLASLFRLRSVFLGTPLRAVTNLYIYVLGWFSLGLTLLACGAALWGPPAARKTLPRLWALFVAWLLLRRAALAGEAAALTGDWRLLRLAWAPPLLLCLTLAAIGPASLTLARNHAHFKGPRTHGADTYGR